jgi:WD40 repeat protein
MLKRWFVRCLSHSAPLVMLFVFASFSAIALAQNEVEPAKMVSFAKQVRPVLQAKCFGCHQPGHAAGGLDLTQHQNLLAPADSGQPSLVPGAPEKSPIVAVVSTANGQPAMPPSGDPMTTAEQELLQAWIAQGATNDWISPYVVPTPENPPVYARVPSVTALDASPVDSLLAVSGTHEVLLVDTNSKMIRHRLIGLSPRIESVRFSPDGSKLAVAGGRPAEFGELQVWDCHSGQLIWSRTVTADVVRGVHWSPDGTKVSVGCNDKSVRAFDTASAQQILFQNVSDDWVHDTVFSADGSHLISVGRDRTCKLTEVATERFVDNITSITPGVLKGGITAVARHPNRDEILIGGADGIPKVYRVHRLTTRVIGDDANLIRRFPAQQGGIQAVAISRKGHQLAVGSSHEGRGQIQVYSYEFDTALPPELAPLLVKVVGTRTPEEDKAIEDYVTRDVRLITEREVGSGVYAMVFDKDNEHVWYGTAAGTIEQVHVATGEVVWQGSPIPMDLANALANERDPSWQLPATPIAAELEDANRQAPPRIRAMQVWPDKVTLDSAARYVQFVVMGQLEDGSWVDVTPWAKFEDARITVDSTGLGQVQPGQFVEHRSADSPLGTNAEPLVVRCLDQQFEVPLQVNVTEPEIQFVRDVQPMLTRLGCNAGSCHGAADGKNGFKLSLRGYDAIFDLRSLTDELWSRRVSVANPEQSLILQKATGAVPHQGGRLIEPDSKSYWILHQWIAAGAVLEAQPIRTTRIELEPKLPVLPSIGDRQQMRVVAHFSDGTQRDVSREAFVEIGDLEIGKVTPTGQVSALRRGETPVMARYDGCYVATTLTVMGDRTGFVWQDPPQFNEIDRLVAEKWKRMKIQPAELCSDHEFIRRVYFDLTGLPPSPQQVIEFVNDARATTEKRNELVDRLLVDPAYVDYWTNKWADLLQVNSKFLGTEGAQGFHTWIREQIAANVPYDQFVRSILTAAGSNRENPPAAYFKILRDPELMMENTTHLFLATRFNCNKCHDHPFERWTQDQYYQIAAYFAQTGLSEDPASEGKRIGGSAVEGSQSLYEVVSDRDNGEITHVRTRNITPPKFPYELQASTRGAGDLANSAAAATSDPNAPRRTQLADWVASPANPYFASSYVNRVWGYLLGRGLIEPLDDIRASNPPSNPELLAYLERSFIESGFDTRQLMALICKSRTYQLSIESNEFNRDDTVNYSKAKAKRLPAEVLFDAMHVSVGAKLNIPGVPEGTRAAQLADVATTVPSGFLATLGRPVRESACECERSDELQLGAVLAMVNGPDVARLVADPQNKISQLAANKELGDRELIDAIYMHILNRPARAIEIDGVLAHAEDVANAHQELERAVSQRTAWWSEERPRLEAERMAAIARAKEELESYVAQHDPQLADREQQRLERIASLQSQLTTYEANEAVEFARWREEQLTSKLWQVPLPIEMKQSNDSQLSVLPDRSLRATLGSGVVETTLIFESHMPPIAGIRLEALADSELPGGGPGLAANGNLVVSEWIIEVASRDQPEQWQAVAVSESMADFQQESFSSAELFNGVTNDNGDGWALHPDTKKTHWVVAKLAQAVHHPSGTRWRMRFVQNYADGLHALGRFRVSFSTATAGLDLGLAEPYLAELVSLRAAEGQSLRDAAPAPILAAFRAGDQHRRSLTQQLAEASKPVEILPGIVERRAALAIAEQPVLEDRTLLQLQADFARSQAQLDQLRVTLAQDLTWALINSPAFMFNH